MRFVGRCYRGHDPAWSFAPVSGQGAALTGGRFNRRGHPTLYLALDIMTALSECMQGLNRRLQPLTMCEYDVDCEDVADLRGPEGRERHGVGNDALACPWLVFQRAGRDAPSWRVADGLRTAGCSGMLVPSFAPATSDDASNLVLWRWGPDLPHRVGVFDPSGRLPRNQLSWTSGGS